MPAVKSGFQIMARRDTFHTLLRLYAVQRGKHMQIKSLLAFELSLINGCTTHENNIRDHFFEVALVR